MSEVRLCCANIQVMLESGAVCGTNRIYLFLSTIKTSQQLLLILSQGHDILYINWMGSLWSVYFHPSWNNNMLKTTRVKDTNVCFKDWSWLPCINEIESKGGGEPTAHDKNMKQKCKRRRSFNKGFNVLMKTLK